jgi:FSR family fosmidomycin resistance protein-like MFS transporter
MGIHYLLARRSAGAVPAGTDAGESPSAIVRPDDWRAFGTLATVSVFWSIPFVIMSSFAALNVIHRFQVSATMGAITLTAFTAGGIVGTLAGGSSAERWGRLTTIRFWLSDRSGRDGRCRLQPTMPGVLVSTLVLGTALFVPFAAQITLAQDYLPRGWAPRAV